MELGALIIPLLLDSSKFAKSVDDAKNKGTDLQSSLKNIGNVAAGVAAAGFGAIVTGVGVAMAKTQAWSEQLDTMGDALGTTAAQSAGLALMADRVGSSSDYVTGAMSKLVNGLTTSSGEMGPTGLALANLGISATDSSGKIKDATVLFQEISNVIGVMPDSLDKTQIEMDLFGKSGAAMGDVLGAAADGGVKKFQTEAEKMGLAFSEEKQAELIEYGKANKKFSETMDGLAVSVGSKVMPKLTPLIEKLSDFAMTVLPPLVDFITNNLVPILIVLGTVIMVNVVSSFVTWATAAWATAAANIAALAPVLIPILAIAAGIAVVIGIIIILRDHWTEIFNAIGNVARGVGDFVSGVFQGWIFIFDSIGNAIKGVIDWFGNLGNSIMNLQLPSWLTPGSPTPLENGLVGIRNAMKDVSNLSSTDFSASLKLGSQSPINESVKSDNSSLLSALGNMNSSAKIDPRDMKMLSSEIANSIIIAMG